LICLDRLLVKTCQVLRGVRWMLPYCALELVSIQTGRSVAMKLSEECPFQEIDAKSLA
jgi:hypothetical protein